MKPSELAEYFNIVIENHGNVLVVGKPGIGKTEICKQSIEKFKLEHPDKTVYFAIWHPVVDDPTTFKGMPFPDEERTFTKWLPYGKIFELQKCKADYIIIVVDDLGQVGEQVQKPLMQLFLEKSIDGVDIPKHTSFISLTNDRHHAAGVAGILSTIKSRINFGIINLDVDTDDWIKYAIKRSLPAELIAAIKYNPGILDEFEEVKNAGKLRDMINYGNPRTIESMGLRFTEKIPAHLKLEAFSGIAGEVAAIKFLGFIELASQLPVIDFILKYPDTANIPDNESAMYTLCVTLAMKANENNFESIYKYAQRFSSREYQALIVKTITDKEESLINTGVFIKWTSSLSDLFTS